MPTVTMPDGTDVGFPDDMPPDQIKELISRKFPDAVKGVGKSTGEDIGRGTALKEGYLSGASANFSDEVYAASKASGLPDWLGGFRAPIGAGRLLYEQATSKPLAEQITGKGEATTNYEKALAEKRDVQKRAKEQYPGTYMAGNIGGAMIMPGGAAAQGATLPARMGRGAVAGGIYGALSGAGEGTDTADRAVKAVTGGLIGAGVGAVAPPIVEGITQGVRYAARPVISAVRGMMDPAGEASRRLGRSIEADVRADPGAASRLTPQEFQATPSATVMDMGGEATRALARSAANVSPEGRGVLNRSIDERFEEQAPRITTWLRQTFHYPNADAQQQAIEQTAKTVNRGAYARANANPAAQSMWDGTLQQLTSAPAVQQAIKESTRSGANRAAGQGFTPPVNPFHFAPDGSMTMKPGVTPSLQFWDQVQRNLRSQIDVAKRAGDKELVNELSPLRSALLDHLDTTVPAFQQARQGAAGFFKAENALEAGQNFVTQNFAAPATRRALAQMSPQERKLFQDGFVSHLVETIEKTGDRRNIVNTIAQSTAAREKLNIALGPQRAAEFEATLRVEGIMDLARGAVQGNSSTARQLVELGLAGGAGGVSAYNGDPQAMMHAALVWGAARGHRVIDERVAQHVARMLTSNDPQVLLRGIQMVARNNRFLDQFRRVDASLARVSAQQAPQPALTVQGVGRGEDQPTVPRPVAQ